MCASRFRPPTTLLLLISLCLVTISRGYAATSTTNSWTNSVSGLWRDATNWSTNLAPNSSFNFNLITNAGAKTVTIDAATPATNLSIQRLTVSAPVGSTNTLELIDLTINQPLVLGSTLTVGARAALRVTNSAVVINGFTGGILDVTAGTVTLDDGLIDCSTTTAMKIGDANGGTGTLILNGGTLLTDQIQLGALSGSQGVLKLSNGVLNSTSIVSLGDRLNSTGTVSIVGGQLIATNDITKIGNSGVGQLSISGGSGNFAFLSIGDNLNSRGTVSVTSGGQLKLSPRTTNDWLRVGNLGNGQLNLSGGTILVGSELHLADDIVSTGIVAVTGGRLVATNDITAIGRYGVGQMTVSNASVQLTNASVGRHDGSIGTLIVQSNGVLTQIDDLSIGRFPNSIGHVQVAGGLLGLTNDNIFVGREGTGDLLLSSGTVVAKAIFVALSTVVIDPNSGLPVTNTPVGTLTLSGGDMLLSSNLLVGTESISTGQVSMTGGRLIISNGAGNGSLNVHSGTFMLMQGVITTDQLVMTNSTGQFVFNGGLLAAKSTIASNGMPFIVGDGSNPATLQLLGGVYSFANGLVISSNATVSGCGTILGTITNFGTLITNCGPIITATVRNGTTVTVYFTTVAGSNHVLEFKNTLNDPGWTQLLPGVIGNGAVLNKTDTNAIVPSRFYRIRVQ
jgi:T5SS/PEP-CTERM-associated repeat protein